MVNQNMNWVNEMVKRIEHKMELVTKRTGEKIPYTTVEGVYDDWTKKEICWWTNGFWGGMMWQLYHATQNDRYRKTALGVEEKLDQNLLLHRGMDHDSGFKWLLTAVANYRMTKSEISRNRGLLAADNLAGRYNIAGNYIRAWNDSGDGSRAGFAIIDCMMNLPLLYWASEETNDPRYKQVAKSHADMVLKYFIREDGSVNHIVEFEPETGEFLRNHGGQGLGEGSTWTRGEAWAVYGYTLSFLHTKEQRYLKAAQKTADYFCAHISESGLIPVDFDQPKDCTWEDSTAAVIAACGLLELAKVCESFKQELYANAGRKLVKVIAEKRCNWEESVDNIVEKCTAAYHEEKHEYSIIYGDYFFIEAVYKLAGKELFLW